MLTTDTPASSTSRNLPREWGLPVGVFLSLSAALLSWYGVRAYASDSVTSTPSPTVSAPRAADSPHAEAVMLVLQTQQAAIRAAEGERAGNWWLDTDEREFRVKRLFAPCIFDSTHSFEVTYSIAGRRAASWSVDTSTHQVSQAGQTNSQ